MHASNPRAGRLSVGGHDREHAVRRSPCCREPSSGTPRYAPDMGTGDGDAWPDWSARSGTASGSAAAHYRRIQPGHQMTAGFVVSGSGDRPVCWTPPAARHSRRPCPPRGPPSAMQAAQRVVGGAMRQAPEPQESVASHGDRDPGSDVMTRTVPNYGAARVKPRCSDRAWPGAISLYIEPIRQVRPCLPAQCSHLIHIRCTIRT